MTAMVRNRPSSCNRDWPEPAVDILCAASHERAHPDLYLWRRLEAATNIGRSRSPATFRLGPVHSGVAILVVLIGSTYRQVAAALCGSEAEC